MYHGHFSLHKKLIKVEIGCLDWFLNGYFNNCSLKLFSKPKIFLLHCCESPLLEPVFLRV